MNHRAHIRLLTLLLATLLCLAVPATASNVEISEMDDSYAYEYWFSGAQASILLPVTAGYNLLLETPTAAALVVSDPALADSGLAFFTINEARAEDLTREADIQYALQAISDNADALTYTVEADMGEGVTALRVPEPRDGVYSEHLIAVYNGWVLNVMVQRGDGATALTDAERTWQRERITEALASPAAERLQHYAFADSDMEISLSERYYMTMLLNEAHEEYIGIAAVQTGAQHSTVMCNVAYMPELDGLSIDEVDEAQLDAIVALAFDGAPEAGEIAAGEIDGVPALTYMIEGARHLLATHEGWAINLQIILDETTDTLETDGLQAELMRMILSGVDAGTVRALPMPQTVTRVGDAMWLSLHGGVLAMDIPEGFYPEMVPIEDADGMHVFYLLDWQGEALPYQIQLMDLGAEAEMLAQLDSSAQIELLETMEAAAEDAQSEWTLLESGILGYPTMRRVNPAEGYTSHYAVLGGYIIEIRCDPSLVEADGEDVLPMLGLRML